MNTEVLHKDFVSGFSAVNYSHTAAIGQRLLNAFINRRLKGKYDSVSH